MYGYLYDYTQTKACIRSHVQSHANTLIFHLYLHMDTQTYIHTSTGDLFHCFPHCYGHFCNSVIAGTYMCMYMYVCTYVCVCVCVYIYIYIYFYVCACVCMHVHMHSFMYDLHVYMYVYYTCMYTCMHALHDHMTAFFHHYVSEPAYSLCLCIHACMRSRTCISLAVAIAHKLPSCLYTYMYIHAIYIYIYIYI